MLAQATVLAMARGGHVGDSTVSAVTRGLEQCSGSLVVRAHWAQGGRPMPTRPACKGLPTLVGFRQAGHCQSLEGLSTEGACSTLWGDGQAPRARVCCAARTVVLNKEQYAEPRFRPLGAWCGLRAATPRGLYAGCPSRFVAG